LPHGRQAVSRVSRRDLPHH